MINENKGPNSIVSIPVGRNGQLCENGLTITPTGGLGGANTDPFSTIAPNSPDALASLGAVRVVGKVNKFSRLPPEHMLLSPI